MSVVVVSGDLMVASRVQGAAAAAGVRARVAMSLDALTAALHSAPADLVLVDLNISPLDMPALLATVRSTGRSPRVVAFGPHVHEQRLQAAAAAGCDEVLSRGQFFGQIDALLRRSAIH